MVRRRPSPLPSLASARAQQITHLSHVTPETARARAGRFFRGARTPPQLVDPSTMHRWQGCTRCKVAPAARLHPWQGCTRGRLSEWPVVTCDTRNWSKSIELVKFDLTDRLSTLPVTHVTHVTCHNRVSNICRVSLDLPVFADFDEKSLQNAIKLLSAKSLQNGTFLGVD